MKNILFTEFNIGGYYGIKFNVDVSIYGMKASSSVEPFGAAFVYGQLEVGYAVSGLLKLEGKILELQFPAQTEINFSKFPLEVGYVLNKYILSVSLCKSVVFLACLFHIFFQFALLLQRFVVLNPEAVNSQRSITSCFIGILYHT